MENKESLTPGQISFFAYSCGCGNIVYTFTYITSISGRAFWVAVLLGVLLNIPFAFLLIRIGSYMPGGTIFDILETGLGKIISRLLIIIYIIINIALAACMMNMFTGSIRIYFLHSTPSLIIMLFLLVVSAIVADSGMKTFARVVQILSFLYTLNYFLGFFLSFFTRFNMDYITPVFDTTVIDFTKGVLITAGIIAESLMFFMIMIGSTAKTTKKYLSVFKGLAMWSFILSFAIFIMEGDIGNEMLARVGQAGITVSRTIKIKDFIRGLEILVLMTYQYIAIVKVSMFIFCCLESSKKLFNLNAGRLSLIFFSFLILAASNFLDSSNAGYFYSVFLGSYIVPSFVILVLILSGISIFTKRFKKGVKSADVKGNS